MNTIFDKIISREIPADIVYEDELILALPLVPRHTDACLPSDAWSTISDDSDYNKEQEDDKPESPFAILSSLKKQ